MALSIFYYGNSIADTIQLDESVSKHIIGVLRMKTGDLISITDGKGNRYTAMIANESKKACTVKIESKDVFEEPKHQTILAISLLKNANRFEWFLEKATEIGVKEIVPLICERTEKQSFRYDRMQQIVISAMLQSQQLYLPVLHQPQSFSNVINQSYAEIQVIAHCISDDNKIDFRNISGGPFLILIGPEGDFTLKEVQAANEKGFRSVSLGNTRLRTETAGIAAVLWSLR